MRVSVLIGTYGPEKWSQLAQARAVPSALRQPFEVEVIHYHQPAGTVASCRNHLAADADGDWLIFLDADDELAAGYIDAMNHAAASNDRAALFVPHVQYVASRGAGAPRSLNTGRPLDEINYAVIGTMVPAALFRQVGGFQEWPMYEDWDLWLRCVEAGAELVEVPAAVYRAHMSRGRNSARGKRAAYDAIRAAHYARMRA